MELFNVFCIDIKFYEGLGFAPVIKPTSLPPEHTILDARILVDGRQITDEMS